MYLHMYGPNPKNTWEVLDCNKQEFYVIYK